MILGKFLFYFIYLFIFWGVGVGVGGGRGGENSLRTFKWSPDIFAEKRLLHPDTKWL